MKKIVSFSLLAFSLSAGASQAGSTLLVAQSHKIDSLASAVAHDKEDTNKVNDLIRLAKAYAPASDKAKGLACAQQALSLSEKLNYKEGVGLAYYQLGSIYNMQQGNTPASIDAYTKAASALHDAGDVQREAAAYTSIGILHDINGNDPEALKYIMKALDICEKRGDKKAVAKNVCCLGNIAINQKDQVNALNYYSRSLAIFDSVGDKFSAAQVMSNIGNIYNIRKEYDKALAIYARAIQVDEELHSDDNVAREMIHTGEIYMAQGDYAKARDNYQKAMDISAHSGIRWIYISATGRMGMLYAMEKQYKDAERYLLRSLSLADSAGYAEVKVDVLLTLSNVYMQQGNWHDAYNYYMLFSAANDSITNADKSRQLGKLEAKYDFDKQIALQQVEDEKRTAISKAESQRQNAVIAFIAIVALAAAGIALAVFRSLKVTRKQKEEIEDQKKAVEEQKGIVEEKNEEILDSITYAKRLQDAILPPLSVIEKHLPDSFVLYKPKDIVAGDFYWMHFIPSPSLPSSGEGHKSHGSFSPPEGRIQEGIVLIAACDCTGHGVPGAMVSVVCSNALNRAVKEFGLTEPGKILDKTRELVIETFSTSEGNIQDGMDISLMSLAPSNSPEGGTMITWAGAYNPLWIIQDGQLNEIAADKQPIGKADKSKPFTTHTITLNPPSECKSEAACIYLFTDGYADQFGGEKGKKFKYKQLQQLLMDNCKLSMTEQKKALEKAFIDWQGNLEQTDDVCIIGIRV